MTKPKDRKASGITNHPRKDEKQEQQQVPPRGGKKEQTPRPDPGEGGD